MAGQWLATGLPIDGKWLANGLPMVGQWLADGWQMVGEWLAPLAKTLIRILLGISCLHKTALGLTAAECKSCLETIAMFSVGAKRLGNIVVAKLVRRDLDSVGHQPTTIFQLFSSS